MLEVKRFTVKTLSRDASRARVRYDLVWERGRWAIDDIHFVIEPNPWSLRAILTNTLLVEGNEECCGVR